MEKRRLEFDRLLGRYLSGSLLKKEKARFYELIASGDFDELLNEELFNALKNDFDKTTLHTAQKPVLDALYESKIRPQFDGSDDIELPAPTPLIRRRILSWWTVAASVAGMALVINLWLQSSNKAEPSPVAGTEQLLSATEQKSVVQFYDKQFINLPDGSTVLLNEGSELTYNAADFGIKNREVYLRGEAFFDVVTDPENVFVVESESVRTTVLGTAFNVKTLPDNHEVQITVTRGKVSVGNNSETYELLTADQQLTVNTVTNAYLKKELKSNVATVWKDEFVIFDDVTMKNAAELLEGRFGLKVSFRNERLKNCYVTASFLNGEDLDHILQVVGMIHDFTYSVQDNEIILDGNSTCD